MFIRQATTLLPLLLLLTHPPLAAAQATSAEPAQQLLQSIGGDLPATVHVTASGTGYATEPGKIAQHSYWIKSYVLDENLHDMVASENVGRVDDRQAGTVATATRTARSDGPPADQALFWTTVHGFIAGVQMRQSTTGNETVHGQAYQVVSFVTPGGQTIRGYVSAEHRLERIRTSYQDPARGMVDVEQIFRDWSNAGGVTFPRMIITNENGQTARILIVQNVTTRAQEGHEH